MVSLLLFSLQLRRPEYDRGLLKFSSVVVTKPLETCISAGTIGFKWNGKRRLVYFLRRRSLSGPRYEKNERNPETAILRSPSSVFHRSCHRRTFRASKKGPVEIEAIRGRQTFSNILATRFRNDEVIKTFRAAIDFSESREAKFLSKYDEITQRAVFALRVSSTCFSLGDNV